MRRTTTWILVMMILAAGLVLVSATPAVAHEHRRVGRYEFTVGWANEPTYANYPNAVSLTLLDSDQRPVVDLGDTLKVDLTFGGQTTSLALEPAFRVGVFGTPGEYRANLLPTRPGTYVFRFTGTIKGQRVDATFRCGDSTFDCAKAPSEIQFPVKDPTTADLATLIDKSAARIETRLGSVDDTASRANILGYAGIGLGVLALLFALLRGRRPKASS